MDEKSQPQAELPESEDEQEKVIKLLEERLEKHDLNRKAVQGKLTDILNQLTKQVGELEDRINRRLGEEFASEEDRLQAALNELRGNNTTSALQKAKAELRTIQSYEIFKNKEPNNDLTTLYELNTERRTIPEDGSVGLAISEVYSSAHDPSDATEMSEAPCGSDKFAEERERLIELLEERIEKHDNNKKAAQDKLHEVCERLKAQIDELEDRIGKELEDKFTSEDNRLQTALNELRGNRTASALQKAKAELLVFQSYELIENKEEDDDDDEEDDEEDEEDEYEAEEDADEDEDENDSVEPNFNLYELKAERRIIPELMVMRKPTNVHVTSVDRGSVFTEFTCLNPDEERVLSDHIIVNPVRFKCLLFKKWNEQECKEYLLHKDEGNSSSPSFFSFTPDILEAETPYGTKVKMVFGDRESEWSNIAEFTTPAFKECCAWKKCPDYVDDDMKYSVDEMNPRVATKVNSDDCCIIIGNTHIPLNAVISWNIKILESKDNDGINIYIGVAPFDINQNEDDYNNGWYFCCHLSTLRSGPPHKYSDKEYGPRKGEGEYVHTGDSVGVVVDTTKSELSFVLNGVNYGVAYEGIPLDEPLVPCVILYCQGDSVELNTSEVKKNEVNSSVPLPSNATAESSTWNSITLTWDNADDASFYQIEVDGCKSWDASTTNLFIKRGLLAETEHSFRVRTVIGSSVSEWSGVVKGRTLKAPEFSECVWKECPGYVDDNRKYSVDGGNPRIATNVNDGYDCCTIIGNTYVPLNTVTSWNIKVLKSYNNNGHGIYIGVAPFDINQNEDDYNNGWYFCCHLSTLSSGPPHKYSGKEYGPRKKKNGQYVHTGDSVGVVMDTTNGDLSFVLNGVNLGAAYEGIPLDKPLVPCVLLKYQGDSVELDLSEVKGKVDSSVPLPSKITANSTTWDSITLTWDNADDASFYQIEVDGCKSWDASTTNLFIKRGLFPETEHSFRVRAVRGSSVSEWSGVVKGRALKAPEFSECVWEKCPDDVDNKRKYIVNGKNPRVATKVNSSNSYCTIIGNTYIPLNKVTSWNIKILKSWNNNGNGIYIGIAPNDINQNVNFNYNNCGWYFDCFCSILYSGPPHDYWNEAYGPRKEDGQYVQTGDSVGAVVDTTKGELSFVLGGVNLGVAYCGIPLNEPLVPCVLLKYPGDSVELIT